MLESSLLLHVLHRSNWKCVAGLLYERTDRSVILMQAGRRQLMQSRIIRPVSSVADKLAQLADGKAVAVWLACIYYGGCP